MSKSFQNISLINLGCSKNLVDSEILIKQLEQNGAKVLFDDVDAATEVVIINTCGFIHDAREESVDTILDAIHEKKEGNVKKVLVFGCLSQIYGKELKEEIPELDHIYGCEAYQEIIHDLGYSYNDRIIKERSIQGPGHYSYLKISEGCDRSCSFCAIPRIRGKHRSKSMEQIVEEAEFLANKGVREIMLIAQDLNYYGIDHYKRQALPELLEKLVDVSGIDWIRLHYTYPNKFPLEILDIIANEKKICNYLDIPFQHISDQMLEKMRRGITRDKTLKLIDEIRNKLPDIALRTTLLVGHPGETERDFYELEKFVDEVRFDRMGVFMYSHEEGTYAFKHYKDDVPEKVKQLRADVLLLNQQEISLELNQEKIGREMDVLIDRREEEFWIGRTQYDSPEIDNEVVIPYTDRIQAGNFYKISITGASEFDLNGLLK